MGAQAKTRVLEVVAATIVIAGAVSLVGWFASIAGSSPEESDEENAGTVSAVEASINSDVPGWFTAMDVSGPVAAD